MLTGRSSTASSSQSINSERDNLQAPNRGLYNAQQSGIKFYILAFILHI